MSRMLITDLDSILKLDKRFQQWGFCSRPPAVLYEKIFGKSFWKDVSNYPLSDENRAKIKMLLGPHGLTICKAMIAQLEEVDT